MKYPPVSDLTCWIVLPEFWHTHTDYIRDTLIAVERAGVLATGRGDQTTRIFDIIP